MMTFFQEFKTFINRGNAVDLAIGVIIGAAFGKIVNSVVGDIIMPPIGLLIGGVDFSDLSLILKGAAEGKPPVSIKYGSFLNTVIDFIIIAFVVFLVIKAFNKLRGPATPAEAANIKCPQCLMQIPNGALRCGHCCGELGK